ncbi:hypothetical protein DID88_000240 [Monilinia fructigena]|uniref:Uncharacterized protein n=1 Tax=Monilinia fructigena TaxID=38457 RepID=A0A395IJT8_9HELO|nr:hypothetical protein DID88_000240 [Monilinia fructigena]
MSLLPRQKKAESRLVREDEEIMEASEGSSGEESDDSEAERRAAYEAAQTKAGMDGLHKNDDAAASREANQVPPRITLYRIIRVFGKITADAKHDGTRASPRGKGNRRCAEGEIGYSQEGTGSPSAPHAGRTEIFGAESGCSCEGDGDG